MRMCRRDAARGRATLAAVVAVWLGAGPGGTWAAASPAVTAEAARDLQHGQYAVRARAVRLLGYLGGPEHVPALAEVALRDRAREPRNAAATALAQIGAPAAAPVVQARLLTELTAPGPTHETEANRKTSQATLLPLVHALGALRPDGCAQALGACLEMRDPIIRRAALDALALLHDAGAVAALAAAVAQGPADERLAAGASLGWNPHPDGLPALARLLPRVTDRPEVGVQVVFALARQGGDAAADVLTRALEHPQAQVRERAAETLGRLRPPVAAGRLLAALRDPVAPVRGAALVALACLAPEEALQPALAAMQSGAAVERAAAARALGMIDAPDAHLALARAARDHDETVAAVALHALADRDGTDAAAVLIQAAQAGPERARWAALEALAWRGDEAASAMLVEVPAAGPDAPADEGVLPPWQLAAEGLALHGRRHLAPEVGRLLAAPDRRLQVRALEALGMMGGEEALSILCAMDPGGLAREARLARVAALATQVSDSARDALWSALSDRDRAVARLAAEALIFRGPRELPGLVELAEHSAPDGPVPGALNDALRRALDAHGFADGSWDGPAREALARWARGTGADRDPERLRPYAQVLRAQAGEEAALEELRALLLGADTPAAVRDAACRAVGAARVTAAAPLVRDVLEGLQGATGEQAPWARGAVRARLAVTASHALAALGDAEAAGLLARGLGEAPAVRAASIAALARLDPAAATDLLPRAVRDEAEIVRQAALDLLPYLWPARAPALLAEMLPSATAMHRTQVAQMLRGMTGPAEARMARQLAGDSEPTVALAALCALAMQEASVGEAVSAVSHAVRVTCPVPPQDAQGRRALSAACALLSSLHEGGGEPREALRHARRAYLSWPTPEGLERVAQLWEKLGDKSTAQALAARARWERLQQGEGR